MMKQAIEALAQWKPSKGRADDGRTKVVLSDEGVTCEVEITPQRTKLKFGKKAHNA